MGERVNHQVNVMQMHPVMNGDDEYPDRPLVALMTAEQALFEVQQAGQGANGGMNRYCRYLLPGNHSLYCIIIVIITKLQNLISVVRMKLLEQR